MNIAHFSWEYPPVIFGGLGTFATEITLQQKRFGHNVSVFNLNYNNSLPQEENWNDINVYRPKTLNLTGPLYTFANYELKNWGSNFSFFADVMSYNILAAQKLSNLVRNHNKSYDLVDAHDWLGINGGIIAKKEHDIPLFFHVHSTEVGRSTGHGSHTIQQIEYEGGQAADCIITVSHAMKEELKSLGFPEHNIRVCWNAVDPEKYHPDRFNDTQKKELRNHYGIKDDETMLFFVGRLVTVKGVDKLVSAMPEVLKDYPKTKLVILGLGDMDAQLRYIAQQHGISDHIIQRNEFVSEEERILHYAASDAVVLPSIYEPFGIVSTEAMSMAKPTVVGASGTNGMREQIIASGQDKCGIHVDGNNASDIAWGIKQVLEDPKESKQWGINARERVYKEFTWDHIAKNMLAIYKEFL